MKNRKEEIDVYLLAGQSNAAGYTPIGGLEKPYAYGGTFDKEKHDEYFEGYKDILYYGVTATVDPVGANTKLSYVRAGCGFAPTHMGPELGFAEYMSAHYGKNHPDGKKAVLIKYAVGATTLGEFKNDVQDRVGNWMSPAVKRAYTGEKLHEKAGLLYDTLLLTVELAVREIISAGYIPSFKCVLWIQGGGDSTQEDLSHIYASNLRLFIGDLRADLTELFNEKFAGEMTNTDMRELPFVAGKIPPNLRNAKYWSVVREQIQSLAGRMERVRVAETGDFVLPDPTDNNDVWHFSCKDSLKLGRRFAEQAAQEAGIIPPIRYKVTYDADNGEAKREVQVLRWDCAPQAEEPVKAGKKFVCWTLNGEPYHFIESVKEEIVLVARYE